MDQIYDDLFVPRRGTLSAFGVNVFEDANGKTKLDIGLITTGTLGGQPASTILIRKFDQEPTASEVNNVIAAIASIAAEKVDRIARPSAGVSGGLKSIFGGEDLSPNIKTELTEDGVRVEMKIAVEYGYPVHEVAQGIQGNVQKDIEELAGVTVTGVDVYVKKVVSPHTLVSDSDEE